MHSITKLEIILCLVALLQPLPVYLKSINIFIKSMNATDDETLKFQAETHVNELIDKIEPPDHLDAIKLEQDGHVNEDYRKEVFLGNHEEIDKLSEKEQIKKLEEVYHKVDEDKNGQLTKAEISKWIQKKVTEHFDEAMQENKQISYLLDENKDGFVQWSEFMVGYLMAQGHKKEQAQQHMDDYETIDMKPEEKDDMIRYKFRWSDSEDDPKHNKLSVKSAEEFLHFRHPESSKKMMRSMVRNIIDSLDKDNNRILTLEEFSTKEVEIPPGMVIDMTEEKKEIEERKTEFREFIDANKDNEATADELVRYVDPQNPMHADTEASNIIREVDSNRDFQLSLTEVLGRKEFVLGSKMVNVAKSLHDEF